MSTFSDFTFYRDVFHGRLTEDEYNASVWEAHAEILSQTNSRATNAPEAMLEAVKLCECALVDIIAAYKKGSALLPRGVGSISNDGYSVSMGSGNTDPRQAEAQERRATCVRFLQTPENLMCRWL